MALPKRGSDPCHGFVGGFDIVYRGQPRVIMDPTKRDQKDANSHVFIGCLESQLPTFCPQIQDWEVRIGEVGQANFGNVKI